MSPTRSARPTSNLAPSNLAPSNLARPAAGIVAAVAWAALLIQFVTSLGDTGSAAAALLFMARFFTITTNLIIALLFTAIACGAATARNPRLVAGVMLAILLVGIIYNTLLRGLIPLHGGGIIANELLHLAVPILVPLYWLFFTRKGALGARDPWLWAIYPVLYLPYALARGLSGEKYAYPFINVAELGWTRVLLNSLAIAIGFVITGYLVVLLDRRLARRA
ncbi:Pr6Pr family membrane protein [soil metagenome]